MLHSCMPLPLPLLLARPMLLLLLLLLPKPLLAMTQQHLISTVVQVKLSSHRTVVCSLECAVCSMLCAICNLQCAAWIGQVEGRKKHVNYDKFEIWTKLSISLILHKNTFLFTLSGGKRYFHGFDL